MTLVLMGAVLTALGPASAQGYVAYWYKDAREAFAGQSCGSESTVSIGIPDQSLHIEPVRPQGGEVFYDFLTDQPVAQVTNVATEHRDNGQLEVVWTAAGSEHACTTPSAYPLGWETNELDFKVTFRTNEKLYFGDNRDKNLVRPDAIFFGAHEYVRNIHWQSWGGKKAHGVGQRAVNDCKPYCAAGHVKDYPVRVTLSKIRYCGSAFRYVKFVAAFIRTPPGFPSQQGTNFGYLC